MKRTKGDLSTSTVVSQQLIWGPRQLLCDYGAGSAHSMNTQDKGMIHVPGRTQQDDRGFHHVTQDGTQPNVYELFIARIFHLIFSESSWLKPWKAKPWIREDRCMSVFKHFLTFRLTGSSAPTPQILPRQACNSFFLSVTPTSSLSSLSC